MLKTKMIDYFGGNKVVIYLVSFLSALSVGIVNPITAAHMAVNQTGEMIIGLGSFLYYGSMICGTLFLRRVMQKRNLKYSVIAGLAVASVSIVSFPFFDHPAVWLLLKGMIGIGISFVYVGIQTMLHQFSSDRLLGIISGIYSLFFSAGFILGAVFGPVLYDGSTIYPFAGAAASLSTAAVLILIAVRTTVTIPEIGRHKVLGKIRYSIQAITVYGFAEAIIMNLLPVYLIRQNVETEMIGYVLGAFILGSLIGTIPMTSLADKLGREKSLGVSLIIGIIALIGLIFSGSLESFIVFASLAGFGVGPVYAIAIAIVAQNLPKKELPAGNMFFTIFISVGGALGPLISSSMMKVLGGQYLFGFCLLLFCILLVRTIVYIKSGKAGTKVTQ